MRRLPAAFVFILVTIGARTAPAQDYQLYLSDASGPVGSQQWLTAFLDSSGDDIAGWSLGLCHDTSMLDILDGVTGATTLTIAGGDPPDFEQINVFQNGDPTIPAGQTAGTNQAVVIDFFGLDVLGMGTGYELFEAQYELLGPSGSASVDYCDTTPGGGFPVSTVITITGGISSVPGVAGGMIEIDSFDEYTLYLTDATGSPGSLQWVSALLDTSPTATTIAGWSLGICHDIAGLNAVDGETGETTLTINGGNPPDFEQINVFENDDPTIPAGQSPGANQAVVISFLQTAVLSPGIDYELFRVQYELIGAAGTYPTMYCDTTPGGGFPVATVITQSGGFSVDPVTMGAMVTIVDVPTTFVRGDCDGDGEQDLEDAMFALDYLFTSGPAPSCDDACDVNDDGQLNIADPIYDVTAIFSGGAPPPAPFPDCGEDPTDDTLDCASFAACP